MEYSKYISSEYAKEHDIPNIPNPEVEKKCRLFLGYMVSPLEELFLPNTINFHSGYRSPKLNIALKGKMFSQHLQGNALDFDVQGLTLQQAYDKIVNSNLIWDQLIIEGHDNHQWIHCSFDTSKTPNQQRRQKLVIPNP